MCSNSSPECFSGLQRIFSSAPSVVREDCYWNRPCPTLIFSTKTPFETVRGDIRDYPDLPHCEASSIWSIVRHGNRNPNLKFTTMMKKLADTVQSQIVQAYDARRSSLCAQDIENFRKWRFNETILDYPSYLTEVGTREMYDLGKRIRHRYPRLLHGVSNDYTFRTTEYQRDTASAVAFVRGLTHETNLNVTIDAPVVKQDIILPVKDCPAYNMEEVENNLQEEFKKYFESAEYLEVKRSVQKRLGIPYQLSAEDIYELYDLCRYHRTWTPTFQDAWCAVFSDHDLLVLEYRDDISHYYQNGYGFWMSPIFAGPVLQDLRERFRAAVRGKGKNIITYFSHNLLTMQVYTALGLFRDHTVLCGSYRDPGRQWRSGAIASFATNIMVVLNRCTESDAQTHRVQFFVNEKPTELCPVTGCPWEQFEQLLAGFDNNLDFCNLNTSTYIHAAYIHAASGNVALNSYSIVFPLVVVLSLIIK